MTSSLVRAKAEYVRSRQTMGMVDYRAAIDTISCCFQWAYIALLVGRVFSTEMLVLVRVGKCIL